MPKSEVGKTKETSTACPGFGSQAGGTDGEKGRLRLYCKVEPGSKSHTGARCRAELELGPVSCKQKPHHRTTGDCELVPREGAWCGIMRLGIGLFLKDQPDSVRSGWVK